MEGIPEDEYRASVSFLWSAVAFFCWTTLYATLCVLNPRKSYEWHCRIVTVIHGLTVTAMSAWCGFIQGPWPFTHPGGPITPLQRLTISVCLGYFVFDILWCTYFRTEGVMMVIHHSISIIGCLMVLLLGISGTEFIAALFGSEATNPFLQTRWFLRQTNQHKSWLGELNDLVFMLLFAYLRVGVGSNMIYWYLQHPRPIMFAKIGGIMFWLIGIIWFVQILMYAKRKYTLMYRAWKHGKIVYIDPDSDQNASNVSKDTNQNGPTLNGYSHHSEKLKTT